MYRLVDTGAWDDPWFSDQSPDGKLLFLYLLTNRRTNSVGAYEITVRQIVFETGMPSAVVERLLTEMHPKVQWWPDLRIVWVKNFYGRQNNWGKAEINARKVAADLPQVVRDAVCKEYPSLSLEEGSPIDAPSMPHASPLDQHNSNSNSNNNDISLAGSRQRYSAEFESFWHDYGPTNGPKKPAYTAWERLSKADRAAAVTALPAWQASVKWREGFKVYPQKYLNQRFWEGDPSAESVSANGARPEARVDKRPAIKPYEPGPRKSLSPEKRAEIARQLGREV